MLKVNEVSKKFKKLVAVDHVSFEVDSGEIVGILGPNGAGKSTTIKMIAGLLRTSSGTITIDGHMNKSVEAKKKFAYIPEFPEMYDLLTVDEHMRFIAQAYEIENWEDFIEPYFERFDLMDKRDKLGKELSKGMKQKLSICCGLLTQADLYLFDEPMIGLDPKAIRETKKIMSELAQAGKTILVSTHLLDSIEQTCNRVLVMKEGSIIVNSSMADLKSHGDLSLEEIFLEVTEDEII
ncbi:ABC transporter ATP-binding protein [Acidaminobacter sp. JC074]|uniref:ABC transporter ATP-binding protein n=1 Tax=Acidaminobacter sp. JC074 TaxID=2530199 RepID=UPI001F0DF7CF|nr:ABC transporter ATP-binding protein [Acidaminobacter sp. JC074]MCH4886602.1 ABC transporter ATP-binding protein [Acidaminobacter sp. JC074]